MKMAEMDVVTDERSLKTILGSCVGVILHDPGQHISGLAHIMLPRKSRDDTATAKYADTAVPALLARLLAKGGRQAALQALLIGGAQMFPMGDSRLASIGDQNVEAARKALAEIRVPIIFEDIGGTVGRTVTYDNATGQVLVKTLHSVSTKGARA